MAQQQRCCTVAPQYGGDGLWVCSSRIGWKRLREDCVGLRCKRRATAEHRNLIKAECVLFCCLHLRVNSANIRKGWRHWLEDEDRGCSRKERIPFSPLLICVSLVSIRCSHLWHGQLPVRLRGAERRDPMSVSITGATAGSWWKNLRGYVPVFIYRHRPDNWAQCYHSLPWATREKHKNVVVVFFTCYPPLNLWWSNSSLLAE